MQESAIKILIVEDEVLIAHSLEMDVTSFGYQVTACVTNFEEASYQLKNNLPDIVLLDINLNQVLNGIDIGRMIHEQYNIPFIFLTANSDANTIAIASTVFPKAFLNKPYDIKSLIGTIQVAIYNHIHQLSDKYKSSESNFHFVKIGNNYKRINWLEVQYIDSEAGFSKMWIESNGGMHQYSIKVSLDKLEVELERFNFARISRSSIVNANFIKQFNAKEVILLNGIELNIGDAYRKNLELFFKIMK